MRKRPPAKLRPSRPQKATIDGRLVQYVGRRRRVPMAAALAARARLRRDSRPVAGRRDNRRADAYTAAVASATGDDIKIGSASTRVSDFVNRGAEFDGLMCSLRCSRPAAASSGDRSSSVRSTRARCGAFARRGLHVDVRRDSADWPLLGFILMVDDFRPDNGDALRAGLAPVAGTPAGTMSDPRADHDGQAFACGKAGSCSSSTDPPGMATPPTARAVLAARFRAHSFPGTGVPPPTSGPACVPTRAPGSAPSLTGARTLTSGAGAGRVGPSADRPIDWLTDCWVIWRLRDLATRLANVDFVNGSPRTVATKPAIGNALNGICRLPIARSPNSRSIGIQSIGN